MNVDWSKNFVVSVHSSDKLTIHRKLLVRTISIFEQYALQETNRMHSLGEWNAFAERNGMHSMKEMGCIFWGSGMHYLGEWDAFSRGMGCILLGKIDSEIISGNVSKVYYTIVSRAEDKSLL